MPILNLISTNPHHPTVNVQFSKEEAERLGVPACSHAGMQIDVTLDLDWAMVWRLYQRTLRSKGGKAVLGGGTVTLKRR